MAFDNLIVTTEGNLKFVSESVTGFNTSSWTADVGTVSSIQNDRYVGDDAFNRLSGYFKEVRVGDIESTPTTLLKIRVGNTYLEYRMSRSGITKSMYAAGNTPTIFTEYIGTPVEDPDTTKKVRFQIYYGESGLALQVASNNYGNIWSDGIGSLTLAVYGNPQTVNFSPNFGPSSKEEGYENGDFDDSSDTVGVPPAPSAQYASAGSHMYRITPGGLRFLMAELFPTITSATDIAGLVQVLMNQNIINAVIDCHVLPCGVPVGDAEHVKCGYKTLDLTLNKIESDYTTVDCGVLNIKGYYKNFMDFVNTKTSLYLPFIGFVDVRNEWYIDGQLGIKYRFNIYDGSFVCWLVSSSGQSKLTDTVVAEYSGRAMMSIPLNGMNYGSTVVNAIKTGVSAVGSIVSGGITAASTANSAMSLMSNLGGEVVKSNGYSGAGSLMGIRTPYLMIERTLSDFSESYPEEQGLPLNVSMSLSECHGYTEVSDIHLDGIGCTEGEKMKLESLLRNGIIL